MSKEMPLRIVRSSAPLRMNDIGGWTDTWFSREGKVLNLGLSLKAEVEIQAFKSQREAGERVVIHAVDYGETFAVDPGNPDYTVHPLLQGAVSLIPVPPEYRLVIRVSAQAPGGSSLGTSAAVCVAILGALDAFSPQRHSRDEIVSLAHRVETEKLGLQSGIQDQICAAYGGICFIHMRRFPEAEVQKLALGEALIEELNRRLCLVYLGKAHRSSFIHEEVIASLEKGGSQSEQLARLRDLAEEARTCLLHGNLQKYGEVMIRNNECQRALHPALISRDAEEVIEVAKDHGASGWKVNGAGGEGGSLSILASVEEAQKRAMIKKINSLGRGIRTLPFSLSSMGLTVTILQD